MYSFYGGRPGNSFIIVKTFDSYEKMVTQFKKGPGYSDVHYDEHVLINTLNKLDEDNGKVYRRGYNFNADDGGAEYIGTIVGPQGNAPHLYFTNPETVQNLYDNHESESGSIVSVMDYDQSETESNLSKPEMIAGKDSEGKFHDNIVWKTVSIRTKNNDITNAYIGLTIPYHVFEFSTQSISEYKPLEVIRTNNEHPFFYPMLLKIPKGIHGSSVTDLRITTLALEGNNEIIIPQGVSIGENVPFFACTIESYDSGKENSGVSGYENSTKQHYFIDFYKVLNDLELNEEGILTKKYNDGSQEDINTPIKWIDNIELSSKGELKVKYNTNNTSQTINSQAVKWINNIELSPEGQLQVKYNIDKDNDEPHIINNSQAVKWIKSINLSDDGQLQVTYNTNDQVIVNQRNSEDGSIQKIKWLTGVTLTPAGNLTFDWNVGPSTTFDQIRWIKEISLSEDGILYIGYNNTDEPAGGINSENPIKWIKEMTLDQATGALKITWNTEDEQVIEDVISQLTDIRINKAEDVENQEDIGKIAYQINNGDYKSIGEPINYIEKAALNDNNQLLVKYSDPNKNTGNISWNDEQGWTSIGDFTTNFQLGVNEHFLDDHWTGIGEIVENPDIDGVLAHIDFTIAPSYYLAHYLNCEINTITLTIKEINPINAQQDRSFSNLILNRYRSPSTGLFTNNLEITKGQDEVLGQETTVPVGEVISLNITPAGIHFRLILNKDNFNSIGYSNITPYPNSTEIGNSFCYISISNLSINFNRTDLSGSDTDTPLKVFNGKYLEYLWDSRKGWQSAMTEDLLTPATGKTLQQTIAEFNARKRDANGLYKTYSQTGDYTDPNTGQTRALAMKVSRQWHGEGGGYKDDGALFIDLVRPEPLRQRGVKIVSIQPLWFESSLPLIVYTRTPGVANPSFSPNNDSDSKLQNLDMQQLNAAMAETNRQELECIKFGSNQYFRIIIRNPENSGRTVRNLHIVLRFVYYIDNSLSNT